MAKNIKLKDREGSNLYPETKAALIKDLKATIIDILNTLPTSKVSITYQLDGLSCLESLNTFYPGGHVTLHIITANVEYALPDTVEVVDGNGVAIDHTWDSVIGVLKFILPETSATVTATGIPQISKDEQLIFTAATNGTNHIYFTKSGSVDVEMQYCIDGFHWVNWEPDTPVELNGDIGEKLYVRNLTTTLAKSGLDKFNFHVDEPGTDVAMLKVSGDLYALINHSDVVPAYTFYATFDNCKSIISLPSDIHIPTEINEKIFYCFAYNCSGLKIGEGDKVPVAENIVFDVPSELTAEQLSALEFAFSGTGGSFNDKTLKAGKRYYWYE